MAPLVRGARDTGLKVSSRIADFIYPRFCRICDVPIIGDSPLFCLQCASFLKSNRDARLPCPKCGINRAIHVCVCAKGWDPVIDQVHAVFDFEKPIQLLVHQIKYERIHYLAYHLAKTYGAVLQPAFSQGDFLSPVPLHFLRQWKRSFNQADIFARGLRRLSFPRIPLVNLLQRKRHTHTQTRLDRTRRQENLERAFGIIPWRRSLIREKRVILVDDVVTTGATVSACAHVLKAAGARSVTVVCLARA